MTRHLDELNEVEQKAVMLQIRSNKPPTLHGETIIIPDEIMVSYRCYNCKEMKYVRVHINDFNNVADTVKCICSDNSYMRIKNFGAGNIALLTSTGVVKKKFTLDDFF